MRIVPFDEQVRAMWKTFPLRVPAKSPSPCHRQPMLLVQSMEGGFVSQNCTACGKPETLPEAEFLALDLWVACPECRRRMTPGRLPHANYGYICGSCDVAVKLAELLPRWTDIQPRRK